MAVSPSVRRKAKPARKRHANRFCQGILPKTRDAFGTVRTLQQHNTSWCPDAQMEWRQNPVRSALAPRVAGRIVGPSLCAYVKRFVLHIGKCVCHDTSHFIDAKEVDSRIWKHPNTQNPTYRVVEMTSNAELPFLHRLRQEKKVSLKLLPCRWSATHRLNDHLPSGTGAPVFGGRHIRANYR